MKPWQLMLVLAAVYDATNNYAAAVTFIIAAFCFFVLEGVL